MKLNPNTQRKLFRLNPPACPLCKEPMSRRPRGHRQGAGGRNVDVWVCHDCKVKGKV